MKAFKTYKKAIIVLGVGLHHFLISLPAHSEDIFINLDSEGSFEVLYHRVESTATGAVIGGLIGAAVEESIHNSKDNEKEGELLPLISNSSCHAQLIETLSNKLKSNGYEPIVVNSSLKKEQSPALKLKIKSCGFRMVNQVSNQVSSFVDLRAELHLGGSKDKSFDDKFYLTSKNQYLWDELLEQDLEIETEFNSALERAGNRIANKFIYRKKEG